MSVRVMGGKIEFKTLNSSLDDKSYAQAKAHIWLKMLNDGMKPKRWLKSTKKGTGIHFNSIGSQQEYDSSLLELEQYLNAINKQYNLEYKINRNA